MLADLLQLADCKSIAIIGAGGKTTLLWMLAQEYAARNARVLVTTSTHMRLPTETQCSHVIAPQTVCDLPSSLPHAGITAALYPAADCRCTGIPAPLFAAANLQTDCLLYEADGSREHPVKLYAPHEPVLYAQTDVVIAVCGLSALHRPVQEVCHRYERLPRFAQAPCHRITEEDIVELAAGSLSAAQFPKHKCRILLNQADTVSPAQAARICAALQAQGYVTATAALAAR